MRIGQLARKYNIKQGTVISFLNEVQAELGSYHHNSKLSNDLEDLIIDHFSLSSKVAEVAIEEQSVDVIDESEEQNLDERELSDTQNNEKTEADLQQELDPTLPTIQASAIIKIEEKPKENSIDTDTLMELLESEEASSDLGKITHIKAPKKELSGLKVVGKIELPEPKSISVDESKDQDKATKPVSIRRSKNQQLINDKKDSTRQKIKEQKERYDARQEKQRIESEKKKRKAQNRARYQEKMQKVKSAQVMQKTPKKVADSSANEQPQVFKSISVFDRFWKLFNL